MERSLIPCPDVEVTNQGALSERAALDCKRLSKGLALRRVRRTRPRPNENRPREFPAAPRKFYLGERTRICYNKTRFKKRTGLFLQ